MDFGEKLKLLRQERNLNQPELAEQLDIEQSYLSKLETGKSLPSAEVLQRILKVLDVSLDTLLEGLDEELIRKQMGGNPQITNHLNSSKARQQHRRQLNITGAAIACTLGLTLLVCGWLMQRYPDAVYQYASTEIVPRGTAGESFSSLADYSRYASARHVLELADSNADNLRQQVEQEEERLYYQLSNLRTRQDRQSFEDLGESFSEAVNDPQELQAVISAGIETGATRTFQRNEVSNVYRIDPRLLYALGALLLFAGMFGFIVDKRLHG